MHDAAHLPFATGRFDLVINRHGAYEPCELRRMLASGGSFVTQQDGSQTNRRLHELLDDASPANAWNLGVAVRELQAAGFAVTEKQELFPISRFFDVGAIVYYLKAIAWEIPNFSVDRYVKQLLDIHARIESDRYLDVAFHQFFLSARSV